MKNQSHVVGLLVVLLFWCTTASAHQTGASTFVANVDKDTGKVETLLAFPGRDAAEHLGFDPNLDGVTSAAELAPRYAELGAYVDSHILVENDGKPCDVVELKASPIAQALDNFWYLKAFQCGLPLGEITFTNTVLLESTGSYRHFARIQLGEVVQTTAFNSNFPAFKLKVAEPESNALSVFARYLVEGLEHITLGPDHVLFVILLILIAAGFKRMVWVVSSFTFAHSITLGLSALNLVNLSPAVIEPAIALTIAFVAVETMVRREPPRYLVAITFIFGLVHGFGFSYVLRDNVGLPTQALLPALAGFNIGVELGQLGIVLLLFPARRWLMGKAFERKVVVGLSVIALGISIYWFFERTLGFHV
jgi:hypothetical protein